VQLGRFVPALDTPASGLEYQQADCAPKESNGCGEPVSVTSWTQAGRSAAALDPLQSAAGFTEVQQ
jgi:hypothetical protein